MAWDEWEQLKADALRRQRGSPQMQLNELDGGGGFGGPGRPGTYGGPKVADDGLTKSRTRCRKAEVLADLPQGPLQPAPPVVNRRSRPHPGASALRKLTAYTRAVERSAVCR